MLFKFFLAIFIVVISQNASLSATDIYPDNLPDLFWGLREHFYKRLANPTATKANFQTEICEFVRVCDYISSESILRSNLRKDFEKYIPILTTASKADVLSVLDGLEETARLASEDFYSTRPMFGYVPTAVTAGTSDETISIYPSNISSYFWVAREHFYDLVRFEESTFQELRNALCELISIGDHVASAPFMATTLQKNFKVFSIKSGMKPERKREILNILSELEANTWIYPHQDSRKSST